MSQNIEEAQEAAPTLCQAIPPVIFHPDAPVLSPSVLARGSDGAALPARANTDQASPALTDTAALKPATSTAIGRNKINSNCAQPIYGQIASPSPPSNPDNDITLAASFGGSDGNSDYVRSAKNSPTRLANKPNLEGHINELETMQEVS